MKDNNSIPKTALNAEKVPGKTAQVVYKNNEIRPYTHQFGNGNSNPLLRNTLKEFPLNAFHHFSQLKKPTQKVFVEMLNKAGNYTFNEDTGKHDYLVECKISINPGKTQVERNAISNAFIELNEKGLARRIKNGGHYMINPNFLVPTNYTDEINEWKELDGPNPFVFDSTVDKPIEETVESLKKKIENIEGQIEAVLRDAEFDKM